MSPRPDPILRTTLVAGLLLLGACQDSDSASPLAPEVPEEPNATPVPTAFQVLDQVEGYPEVGEIADGWVIGPDGRPMAVVYEIHDGLAIWQGDIVIGRAGEIAATRAELSPGSDGPLKGVVIDGGGFRWTNGVIPYEISGSLPNQSRVTNAIDWVEDQTPGVTLVPRSGEADFVRFVVGTGCSSPIGRQGGQQNVNLAGGCTTGNTAHEILHALGMYHEHTRCDRDDFVTINYGNISSGRAFNFYKAGAGNQTDDCGTDQAVFDVGDYDFGSIMHYPLTAFTTGGNTIDPIVTVPVGVTVGQRAALSDADAETIDAIYGTNNAAPSVSLGSLAASYPEGSPVPFDASGSTDADDDDDLLTFSWSFGDGTCPGPAACSDDDPAHTYADNGTFGYGVTVSDGFDASAAGSDILITNVAPSVGAGAATATIDEGATFVRNGSFTDPGADTWTATVNYGDGGGAMALALTAKTFAISHTYLDNAPAPYPVTVEVTDDDSGFGTAGIDVTVNNVAPTVEAGTPVTLTSGATFDFSGSFSDPGIVDNPWSWVITWNDGQSPATTSASVSDQTAAIQASRQVCAAGDYTVNLEVTDKDAGKGSDGVLVQVGYVAVDIDISPGRDLMNPVNLGQGGNLPVAVLSSPTFDATTLDPSTLTLGDELGLDDTAVEMRNNGSYQTSIEDVNRDGLDDLVLKFQIPDLVGNGDLTQGTTELVFRGFQADGCVNVRGTDAVVIRP